MQELVTGLDTSLGECFCSPLTICDLRIALSPQRTSPVAAVPEHDRVNGRTTSTSIGILYELAHKGEVKCSLHMAIEVIRRNQVLKRHFGEQGKMPLFAAHH